MIEILHPMEFELPCPLPIEMSIILNSVIEKYFVHDITAGDYVRAAEGFFRSVKRRKNNNYVEYVLGKTQEIYDVLIKIQDYIKISRIDYLLTSGLMIGVYIMKDKGEVIGCIKGCRADKMTEEEFINSNYE
ncbi:hypothetical protein [Janthinobacterium sp. BJB304]|uniref:hypothetical protein n=1 Tax=Janthinobacterium sp. BJB304 TaxID=1572871 RepID=UPI001179CD3E|nr:hypothetical protein [Janthinobacterium sp. BJB304]